MAHDQDEIDLATVGGWAKRCYFAGRAVMDSALRPYDLGSTQWYVLWQLANVGPTMQRDLAQALDIEKATLSGIVATLVRKELVSQVPDATDQRQRLIELTEAGRSLWSTLPNLNFIHQVAFGGLEADAIATTIRVLQAATERLDSFSKKGIES
jgi:DNA-binding MarR family transcriptional regulator